MNFAEQNGAIFNLYIRSRTPEICAGPDESDCIVDEVEHKRFTGLMETLLSRAQEAGTVRKDIPVSDLVWALQALLQTLLRHWCQHPNQVSLRKRGEEVVALFLQGACVR